MQVNKKIASGALAVGLLFSAAACEDNSSDETEDISPEIDDNGGEDGLTTEDISPEIDDDGGEDGVTGEDISPELDEGNGEDGLTDESGE